MQAVRTLPDCTGCDGQLGFISVTVDNREGERGGGWREIESIWKRKKRETKEGE